MRQPLCLVACLAQAVLLTSCDPTGPFGPVDPNSVRIELTVSGGFRGVDYAFVIDGSAGEVRGLHCVSGCGFSADERLTPLSGVQIADLAARLEEAGVVDADGTDYGTQCCDQFYYELDYRHDGQRGRIEGSSELFPTAIRDAIHHLRPLELGWVPGLVRPESWETEWPRDAFELEGVSVSGTTLTVDVAYGGGCVAHPMDLVLFGGWMESNPIQINALISHEDGNDPCDAWIQGERNFDLGPLVRAYHALYGTGPATVRLRLWDPDTGSPNVVDVEVSF